MKRYVKLNDTLHVNPSAIVALQENGNGSTTVTLARDVTFTVQRGVDDIVEAIAAVEGSNFKAEMELLYPANDTPVAPTVVQTVETTEAATQTTPEGQTEPKMPPVDPQSGRPYTVEELALRASETSDPAELQARATEQAVGQ